MNGYEVRLKNSTLYCEKREYFPLGYVTLTNVYGFSSYTIKNKFKKLRVNESFLEFENYTYYANIEFCNNSIEIPIDKIYAISEKEFFSYSEEDFIKSKSKELNKLYRKENYDQLRFIINYVNLYRKEHKQFNLFQMKEMSFEEKKKLMKFYINNRKDGEMVYYYNPLRKNLNIKYYEEFEY